MMALPFTSIRLSWHRGHTSRVLRASLGGVSLVSMRYSFTSAVCREAVASYCCTYVSMVSRFLPQPGAVMFLDSLPLSANGKIDRKRLPLPSTVAGPTEGLVTPTPGTEAQVAELFATLLAIPLARVGATQSFFELGGDSLAALRLLSGLGKVFGQGRLSVAWLFEHPTVRSIAESLGKHGDADTAAPVLHHQLSIIELQPGEVSHSEPPLVLMHAAGSSSMGYHSLVQDLSTRGRAIYGIEDTSLSSNVPFTLQSIQDAGRAMAQLVLSKVPQGTVSLGGWSYGGVVAVEALASS